jgi:hypothetical protein
VISLARNYDRKTGFRSRGHLHPPSSPRAVVVQSPTRKPGLFFLRIGDSRGGHEKAPPMRGNLTKSPGKDDLVLCLCL